MPRPSKRSGTQSVEIRAVIDTNVWVSSLLNPAGRPAMLRKAFAKGDFQLVVSKPVLEELAEVLKRPWMKEKYDVDEDDVEELLTLIEDKAEYAFLSGNVSICRDTDDNCVIETAIKGKAEYLVTGDRDIKFDNDVVAFLSKHAVSVISIADFLSLFNKP